MIERPLRVGDVFVHSMWPTMVWRVKSILTGSGTCYSAHIRGAVCGDNWGVVNLQNVYLCGIDDPGLQWVVPDDVLTPEGL